MFQEYIGFPKCFSVTQLEYIKKTKTSRPNNTRKDLSPGPKNQNFQKMKETSQGIHPRNKCAKLSPGSEQTHIHCKILVQLKLN